MDTKTNIRIETLENYASYRARKHKQLMENKMNTPAFYLIKNGTPKKITADEAKRINKQNENEEVICYARSEFEAIKLAALYDHNQIGIDNQASWAGTIACLSYMSLDNSED